MVWGIPVHGREHGLVLAVENVERALLLGWTNHGVAEDESYMVCVCMCVRARACVRLFVYACTY